MTKRWETKRVINRYNRYEEKVHPLTFISISKFCLCAICFCDKPIKHIIDKSRNSPFADNSVYTGGFNYNIYNYLQAFTDTHTLSHIHQLPPHLFFAFSSATSQDIHFFSTNQDTRDSMYSTNVKCGTGAELDHTTRIPYLN